MLALLALLGVIFEEFTHINKAKVTLLLGTVAWLILFITSAGGPQAAAVQHGLTESLTEISQLWLFLIAAMTFVAYLNKKGMIQGLIYLFLPKQLSERRLLYITGAFCFVFSSLADNITATLVSVTLILSLDLPKRTLTRFAALVVFAVNSGGVALITGDVTTLMIFLAGKVTVLDLLILSVPAAISVMFLAMMLGRGLHDQVVVKSRARSVRQVDIAIAITFLLTIVGTIIGNAVYQIPPVLSFLTGMSVMFMIARMFNEDDDKDPIMDYVRLVEFDTLLFFLGVLLLVGMLSHIQVLDDLLVLYYILPPEFANFAMGILSAIIDNVPLTAALLKSGVEMDEGQWLSLTYAVGVGGSLLVIGSAAGIVAMSKIPGLTFARYSRQLMPLFLAYLVGYSASLLIARWWV